MAFHPVLLIFSLQALSHIATGEGIQLLCGVSLYPLFKTGQFRDGDVRLVGGSYQWEGRVEIFYSGSWGTISDSYWTSEDAAVACRMLGYFRPGEIAEHEQE